jgi:hypothetical protein
MRPPRLPKRVDPINGRTTHEGAPVDLRGGTVARCSVNLLE